MPSDASPAGGRLHPVSLLFRVLSHARGLLVPAVLLLVFARGQQFQALFALFLFLPFLLGDVVHYLTLRWRYAQDELVITQGWLVKKTRHVPYARIQNLDLKQNLLHRLLRVAEVRIETASGAEPEAVLRVVGLAQYEELRARVFAGARPTSDEAAPRAERLLQLGPADVALLALDLGRGFALLLVVWGFAWEYHLAERLQLEERLQGWLTQGAELSAGATTALYAVLALVALYVLSFGGAALAFLGFTLEQDGEVFRVRRGLLTREVLTIPRRRIQVVLVREPFLLRLLGRARVIVGTAGAAKPDQEHKHERGSHIAPIVRRADVPALLARIRPDLDLDAAGWRALGRTAPRRFVIGHLLRAVPVAVALGVLLDGPGLAAGAALVVLAIVHALLAAPRATWARPAWGVAWRRGVLGRETSATFPDKVQAVTLAENPFDRRHGHATLAVDTAGALSGSFHPVRIPYLPRAEAEALREDLVTCAAGTRFRW